MVSFKRPVVLGGAFSLPGEASSEAGYSHTSCAGLVVLRLGYTSKRLITAIARRRVYRLDAFALLARFEQVVVEVEHEQSNSLTRDSRGRDRN